MADLDNGLPPEGIDVTDNRISSVNIGRADADNMNINDINSINISSLKVDVQSVRKVSAILVSTEPAGRNIAMFL
ncbi:hypothetical protein [Dysgonomonas termitidis]|uniref:Uncharacterized protein n=1 Tax=Dysgonomonas termitidis TaxID=1516126 RepID=A0ABV9KQ04_9BACT